MGRPTITTTNTVRKLEAALRSGLNVSQACYTSGIGRTAYYARLENDEAFANKMRLAQEYVTIKAKQLVVQEIEDGNLAAAKWWLERKAKDEFGSQPQVIDEPPQSDENNDLKQLIDEWRHMASIAVEQAEARQAAEATAIPA